MTNRSDVIVIGGGHNGLVAAGYLSRAGLKVTVLERLERLGGPAARIEWLPGYFSSVTNSPGSLEPLIVRDMDLPAFGLNFIKPDPTLVHPLDGNRLFAARRDRELTARQLDAFAPGEARRYDALFEYLGDFATLLGISLFQEPPTLSQLVARLDGAAGQEAFARVFFGSATEFLSLFLKSAEARAIVGVLAAVSGPGSPSIPGTVLNLLMRPLSLASSPPEAGYDPRRLTLRGSTGLPIGGMGAVIAAMEKSVVTSGVEIRRQAEVTKILCADGRTTGVVTKEGDEFLAPIVISAMSPQRTVLELIPELSEWDRFKELMAAKRYDGGECKVILAIDGPPRWGGSVSGVSPDALASAQFRIGPTPEYIETAYAEKILGRVPEAPVIWGLVPSMTSPGMAPEGRHLLSLNVGAPIALRDSSWSEGREVMVKNCVSALSRWMPTLQDQILDYRCITPDEFQDEFALSDSEICHGEMLPGNQFWMRPLPGLQNYRTPTRGLYLSGAGVWPGNFFSGIPGHNTSRAVLHDLRTGAGDLTVAPEPARA